MYIFDPYSRRSNPSAVIAIAFVIVLGAIFFLAMSDPFGTGTSVQEFWATKTAQAVIWAAAGTPVPGQ